MLITVTLISADQWSRLQKVTPKYKSPYWSHSRCFPVCTVKYATNVMILLSRLYRTRSNAIFD